VILIDTHAHLYADAFDQDRPAALARALAAGIETILLPNIDAGSIPAMLALEAEAPATCRAMMGLHPCSVGADWEAQIALVADWLARRPFVGVGECGLDLYWDKTFFEEQKAALRAQLQLAGQYKLPLSLHTREAFRPAVDLVAEAQADADGRLSGVFHCFTGSLAEAEEVIALGFKLGIGGVATFKNGGLDKVLPHVGLEHLVLETDCPYLAPVPHRGKRNEPAYVPFVLHRVAELTGHAPEAVAEVTTATARAVFVTPTEGQRS